MGTRDRILDAAALVMRTRGFARTTTREIARAAGFSEATLYKHFQDKSDLFLAVLHERLPSLGPVLGQLTADAGQGVLRDRLAAIARDAIAFYEAGFPISASVFSEPELLAAHRAAVTRRGAGPHRPIEAVARYLRAEQEHGRIHLTADCAAAAALLVGACFQYAFLRCFAQDPADPEAAAAQATSIADTLLAGLAPPAAAPSGPGRPAPRLRRQRAIDRAGSPGLVRLNQTGVRPGRPASAGTGRRPGVRSKT